MQFLAVPSLQTTIGRAQAPAIVATTASMIAAIGSIIMGLLLAREHRGKTEFTADDAVRTRLLVTQFHNYTIPVGQLSVEQTS